MIYPYKLLIRTALILAPIMVFTNSFPLLINEDFTLYRRVAVLLFAFPVMLLYWGINIALIRVFQHLQKPYIRYITSVIIIISVLFFISLLIDFSGIVTPSQAEKIRAHSQVLKSAYFTTIFNDILILFILDLVISKSREKMAKNEITELRIKNLEVQQLQLRQQLQPHFLFNSLNTLKSLISNHPLEAEKYLVKLSSFLRYNLSSNDQDLISLKEELAICADYLEIQKVRFKEALQYKIDIADKNTLDYKLPVFAIQLLIENSIKHNMLTVENPLLIVIKLVDSNKVSVCNNLQEKKYNEYSTQIGLKNLSERYNLLMKKEVEIHKSLEKFEVILPLQ